MASATYLQSLDSVYEDGTSRGVTPSNRRQIETFIAKEVIAIGDWVAFDIAATADGDVTLGVFKADAKLCACKACCWCRLACCYCY